ncbi:MAG: hypothetical protein K0R65_1220 [Crocinitomicaceae bacterium]|nr:hypothetical protein [Crocinitomicaceae bacterium]
MCKLLFTYFFPTAAFAFSQEEIPVFTYLEGKANKKRLLCSTDFSVLKKSVLTTEYGFFSNRQKTSENAEISSGTANTYQLNIRPVTWANFNKQLN